MTSQDVHSLCRAGGIPGDNNPPELVETHISWVLIGHQFVYKIKKPLHYSFLDFSTPEKRSYYCRQEVDLNRRLTEDIYLGVLPVRQKGDKCLLDGTEGSIIDHAVWMRKMDPARRMDLLARKGSVNDNDIVTLASLLARFHQDTTMIPTAPEDGDEPAMQRLFNDLSEQTSFLNSFAGPAAGDTIRQAIDWSDQFLHENAGLIASRRSAGFFRDGHGDLHCRNIFLLDKPQVFDCIEFSDELRQIDVLNDIAFLCMDLDSCGLADLSHRFFRLYTNAFPCAAKPADRLLFHYYKAYRANIRAKINSLRARTAPTDAERAAATSAAIAYLRLLDSYRQTAGRTAKA